MTASWPGTVPYKARRGTFALQSGFRAPTKTDLDDGNTRQRRSATKNIASLSFSIKMTGTQFQTLLAWVRDTLIDGTLPFTMNVWTGTAYASRTCNFAAPYSNSDATAPFVFVGVSLDVEDY